MACRRGRRRCAARRRVRARADFPWWRRRHRRRGGSRDQRRRCARGDRLFRIYDREIRARAERWSGCRLCNQRWLSWVNSESTIIARVASRVNRGDFGHSENYRLLLIPTESFRERGKKYFALSDKGSARSCTSICRAFLCVIQSRCGEESLFFCRIEVSRMLLPEPGFFASRTPL